MRPDHPDMYPSASLSRFATWMDMLEFSVESYDIL